MLLRTDDAPGVSERNLKASVPAIFTEHHRQSELYRQVPTIEIIRAFNEAGYFVTSAQQEQARRRDPATVIHRAVLRHRDHIENPNAYGEQVPQIVLMNAHNGTASLRMYAGLYRFVCANGLIVGHDLLRWKNRHTGDVKKLAHSFAAQMTETLPEIHEKVKLWQTIGLTPAQQLEFAQSALVERWGKDTSFTASSILEARRAEDHGDNLWRVYNRIQENTTKGGITTQNHNGRRVTSGNLDALGRNTDYNQFLWDLAEETALMVA